MTLIEPRALLPRSACPLLPLLEGRFSSSRQSADQRSAALSCLFGEDESGSSESTRVFPRTSPRRDEALPGCRDRGGSADRCVSAACFASCKFQHLGQRDCLLRSCDLMRLKHLPLYCRKSSASNRERRAERRRGMVLSHSLCGLRYFMWMNSAKA